MTGTLDRVRSAKRRVAEAMLPPLDRYPHQERPEGWVSVPGSWWLLSGGRDAGKTFTASWEMTAHVVLDPPCFPESDVPHRMAIVAPTLDDAREAAVWGPSGLLDRLPGRVELLGGQNGKKLRWYNGSEAFLFSMETKRDVDRLRGPGGNRCFAWVEEGAAGPKLGAAIRQLDHALRRGAARGIMTTTPRRRRAFVEFAARPEVHITMGSTFDNRVVAESELGRLRHSRLLSRYGDSATGRQEIYGLIDGPVEGALFEQEWIDRNRLLRPPRWDDSFRVAVGVDPSAGARDATGLVAVVDLGDGCGCEDDGTFPHFGVVDDATKRLRLAAAMRRAASFIRFWNATEVVLERNGIGGRANELLDMADPTLPVVGIVAEESKELRADPVAVLYESDRVHHVGSLDAFSALEDEMTTWVPPSRVADDAEGLVEDDDWSPDRLDAMVYAVRSLAGLELGTDGGWRI